MLLAVSALALPSCKDDTSGSTPAAIRITSPQSGAIVNDSRVLVQGSATGVDQLDVNGVVAEVVGDEWEALIPLSQGEVTVTATGDGASDSVTFTVDSIVPTLAVLSPERAIFMHTADGPEVTVTGTVSDSGVGLEIVKVGEQILRPDADGSWSYTMPLSPGINEIRTVARDLAGNETTDVRAVMFGDYVDPTIPADPGFTIFVSESAAPAVESVVKATATPENLMMMLQEGFQNQYVTITGISFDPLDFTTDFRSGYIALEMTITNLQVLGNFTLSNDTFPAIIEIKKMTVRTNATPIITPEGALDIEFSDAELDLLPEDLSYDLGDLSDEDNQTLEGLIVDVASQGFGWVLSRGLFSQMYDPAILNRHIEILGRVFQFHLQFKEIDVFPDGILVQTTIEMGADQYAGVRTDVPGALNRTPGPASGAESFGNMDFIVTEMLVDRLLHGVWRAGMVHWELKGADFAGIELPVQLTAAGLGAVLGNDVLNLADPTTPAGMRLRPMFAPVAEFEPEQSRLLIRWGEFWVDFLLFPPGKEPIVIGTMSAFLDLAVNIRIESPAVYLSFDTDLRADLAFEGAVDLDDENAERLLEDLIALIPQIFSKELVLSGESDITWVKLTNPDITVHGVNKDYATISLDMLPNPDGM